MDIWKKFLTHQNFQSLLKRNIPKFRQVVVALD